MKSKPPYRTTVELIWYQGASKSARQPAVMDSDLVIIARTSTHAMAKRIAGALNIVAYAEGKRKK